VFQVDSIVALSTPPGRSGIGVIRISGPDAIEILRQLTDSPTFDPQPNILTLKKIVNPSSGEILDQALVCIFKGPHSFTGEDVLELHCHGSPIVLRAVIDAVLTLNVRLANPGEFSLRAVSNGRMQLTEAEAIRDLIDAQTERAVRQATRQLAGEISRRLKPAKDTLLELIVRLESSLEFVEDDLPAVEQDQILAKIEALRTDLTELARTFSQGRLLHDGLTVALVGRPNVGKSSLFNMLLGLSRAIVTDIPGTTRDTISEPMDMDGVPIVLIDTAGIRASTDEIETLGIDRTRQKAADADLVVAIFDGSKPLTSEDAIVFSDVETKPHVIAVNKSDLETFSANGLLQRHVFLETCVESVAVSAKTGAGLNDLRAAILKSFDCGNSSSEGLLITNARHHDLLKHAIEELESSTRLVRERASEEITLIGLHNGLRYLGQITGETTTEEMLGQIFSTFCIGK
jgi:tRNA modification GTPase